MCVCVCVCVRERERERERESESNNTHKSLQGQLHSNVSMNVAIILNFNVLALLTKQTAPADKNA